MRFAQKKGTHELVLMLPMAYVSVSIQSQIHINMLIAWHLSPGQRDGMVCL
jgi:hypothetical protein